MNLAQHPDDEALSALLDGEADGRVQAHVAGCAACEGRRAGLASVVAALREVPPVPPDARETAIRAALMEAALDEADRSSRQPSTLDAARKRRPKRARPPLATIGWLGAAAALLALLAAIPLLSKGSNSEKASTASRAGLSATTSPAHAPSGATASAGPITAPAFAQPNNGLGYTTSPGDLGTQSDEPTLAAALRTRLAALAAAPPPSTQRAATLPAPDTVAAQTLQRCAGPAVAASPGPVSAAPVYIAQLEWRGTPANAYVFTSATGRFAVVTSQASCQVLVSFPL
jgi:hypothetical protein